MSIILGIGVDTSDLPPLESHVTICRVWNVLESYNLQTKKLTRIVASEDKNSRPRQIYHFWIEQVHIVGRAYMRSCVYKVIACRKEKIIFY